MEYTKIYHYTITDHLGNVRSVVDENGVLKQVNNYFAYGGLLNDVQTGADVQTHKYNGKELDRMHGLDTYDYGARNYDAALGQFTTMDPLCEKYYHISPYAYCGGNPVRNIDEKGDSIWTLNQNGQIINRVEDKKHDIFIIQGTSNGKNTELARLSLNHGTVDITNKKGYDTYTVNNDKTGRELFEFFADNTMVEWSRIKIGVKDGENYLSTSHQYNKEYGISDIYNNELNYGKTIPIRAMIHSHPGMTNKPSVNDHDFATIVEKNMQGFKVPIPKFKLYIPHVGKDRYILYDSTSPYNRK